MFTDAGLLHRVEASQMFATTTKERRRRRRKRRRRKESAQPVATHTGIFTPACNKHAMEILNTFRLTK